MADFHSRTWVLWSKKLPGALYFKLTAGWVALTHQLLEVQTCTSRQSPLSKMAINGPSSGGGQWTTDKGNHDFADPCFSNSFPCRWVSLRICCIPNCCASRANAFGIYAVPAASRRVKEEHCWYNAGMDFLSTAHWAICQCRCWFGRFGS